MTSRIEKVKILRILEEFLTSPLFFYFFFHSLPSPLLTVSGSFFIQNMWLIMPLITHDTSRTNSLIEFHFGEEGRNIKGTRDRNSIQTYPTLGKFDNILC